MAKPLPIPALTADQAARFNAKICPEPFSGCWLWTGAVAGCGYGNFNIGEGRAVYASRVAWRLHKGPIPDGLLVLHHCDTPLCCNPDHLFVGTGRENSIDAVKKGRGPRQVLRDKDVGALRKLLREGTPPKEVAAQFGITHASSYYAGCGKTYQYLNFIYPPVIPKPCQRLSDEDVRQIRALAATNGSQKAGEAFDVSTSYVNRLLSGARRSTVC